MNDKMKNLTVRTLSGVVMLALLLGSVLWSPWSFGALLLLVLITGLNEFYELAARRGIEPQRIVGFSMGAVLFFCLYAFAFSGSGPSWMGGACLAGWLFLLLLLPLTFACELFRGRKRPLANVAATLGGVLYVALPVAMLPGVAFLSSGEWDPRAILAFFFIIWANDVFAYLVGMTLGRHRLYERISPKKSWEGFFGGVAGAVAMGAAAAAVLGHSYGMWCGAAVVAAVTGVLGDLVESMFKREAGVKDSGNVIPGHGGVLDRFDSLLLATPFVCVFLIVAKMLEL